MKPTLLYYDIHECSLIKAHLLYYSPESETKLGNHPIVHLFNQQIIPMLLCKGRGAWEPFSQTYLIRCLLYTNQVLNLFMVVIVSLLTIILLYSCPKKGKGTLRVNGFDALSSPRGPGKSLMLTPKGSIPDNFKSGISI